MSNSLTTCRCLVPGLGLLLGALMAPMPPVHAQAPTFAPKDTSCTPCHTCDEPTHERPCFRACLRESATWAPGVPAGRTPPDVVILGDLEDLYRPVPFDHKVHAEMTAMANGCATCHHYTPEGAAHPACRSCHGVSSDANGSAMPGLKGAYHRQCLGCHRDWSHRTACGACHEPNGGPVVATDVDARRMHPPVHLEPTIIHQTSYPAGPVVTFQHGGHARTYGLSCADCHGGASCSSCHDYTVGRTIDAVMNHETCLSCHRQENCQFCHDVAERPLFDHASSVGWALEPYHASVSCGDCHGSAREFAAPSTSCNGCHAGRPGGRFDHAFADADVNCVSCHVEMSPTDGAEPDRHQALGCTACHAPSASGHFSRLRQAYPADFYATYEPGRYQLCFQCHDETMMENAPGTDRTGFRDGERNLHALHVNREKGRTCRACHDVHASDRPFYIRAATPLGSRDAWLPLAYEPFTDGGRCAPGCHYPQDYERGDH